MNLNPIVLAIPIYFLLIGIELLIQQFSKRKLYNQEHMQLRLYNLIPLLFFIACNVNNPLNNSDLELWKSPDADCNGNRLEVLESILESKEYFTGLSQEEVSNLLGKPDRHELYNRNQKFFIYYLQAPNCLNVVSIEKFKHLSLRFNSLGKLSEMVVVN